MVNVTVTFSMVDDIRVDITEPRFVITIVYT